MRRCSNLIRTGLFLLAGMPFGAFSTVSGAACIAGPTLNGSPIVINRTVPAASGSGAVFLDTDNFCIADPDTLFNMTSQFSSNIAGGGAAIFENAGDTQVPGGANAPSFTNFPLTPIDEGYHIHPQGFIQGGTGGGTYTITLWAVAPTILVAPQSGLETTEAGGTATFDVSLNTPAAAPVDIPVSTDDVSEGSASPSIVHFDTGESGPKTVTVTGVADGVIDGNQIYHVVLASAQTTDARFSNQNPPDASVTNVDLDGKIIVSALSGQMTESGGQATFTVRLASAPTAEVTVPLVADKPAEAALSVTSLVFTTANATTPQTVVLTGLDDAVNDGNQTVTISVGPATSSDTGVAGATATIAGTNLDDDLPAILVGTTAALVTDELGGAATFTVRLATPPAADVQVALFVSDATEALVTPATLVFTPANATQPQTVTLAGLADGIVDGNQAYQVLFAPAVSTDPAYLGLVPAGTVSAINEDEDVPPVVQPENSFGGCDLRASRTTPAGHEWALVLGVILLAGLRHRVAFRTTVRWRRLLP